MIGRRGFLKLLGSLPALGAAAKIEAEAPKSETEFYHDDFAASGGSVLPAEMAEGDYSEFIEAATSGSHACYGERVKMKINGNPVQVFSVETTREWPALWCQSAYAAQPWIERGLAYDTMVFVTDDIQLADDLLRSNEWFDVEVDMTHCKMSARAMARQCLISCNEEPTLRGRVDAHLKDVKWEVQ